LIKTCPRESGEGPKNQGLINIPSVTYFLTDQKACPDRREGSQKVVGPLKFAGVDSEIPEKFHFSAEFLYQL
jgi:hypothetical protein